MQPREKGVRMRSQTVKESIVFKYNERDMLWETVNVKLQMF